MTENTLTTPPTLLFLWLFLSLERNHWEKQELIFLEVTTSCTSAGSSEFLLLQKGLRWLWFDETETSQVGWRKFLFQNPVWCLGSWFLPAQTLELITCCGSKWSRNQLGRNFVIFWPKVWIPQMFREFSVKDFSLTCTMDVAGKAFVLSSHFTAGSSPHSSAQHQFLPGILELFSLCQPVPVPPWDFTQEFVRMLLLFLPCPASSSASQKALPTSQICPKAGIARQYCSKCIFFSSPVVNPTPHLPLGWHSITAKSLSHSR